MQYLPAAIVILGSSLILAALMHRANNPRRSTVEFEPEPQPARSDDYSRAAWLIVGAFTLLGVLQLNSYIERERALDTFDAAMKQALEASVNDARLQEQLKRDFNVIRKSLVR